MTPEIIALIIISSVGLITSLVGPLVTGVVEFSRRIEKSSCFGSSLELTKINEIKQELHETKSKHNIMLKDQEDKIKELLDKLNKEKDE